MRRVILVFEEAKSTILELWKGTTDDKAPWAVAYKWRTAWSSC